MNVTRWRRALALLGPALVLLTAALVLLPGLGATGVWTLGELPVLDRTLAALGEPRADMLRSPWLPDMLRSWAYAAAGRTDFGLRLPGALASIGLVALTMVTARRLGFAPVYVALAGCFALATPGLLAAGRTSLGNATGELWLSAGALALVAGLGAPTSGEDASRGRARARRGVLVVLGLACLAAAVASVGIVLGACLPLTLVALAGVAREDESGGLVLPRWAIVAAWLGAAATGFVGLWLSWGQGEGYIPLLGAAKDLELLEEPTKRDFTATLEAAGYQLFPFAGLSALGLLSPGRARWPALWFGVALVLASLWSLSYGHTVAPITLPAALLATAACVRMFDCEEPISARRLLLACAIIGALVLGKDAGRTPQRIASPVFWVSVIEFPKAGVIEGLDFGASLSSMAKRFAALLLVAHVVAPASEGQLLLRARSEPWWQRRWSALVAVVDRLLTRVGERGSGLARLRVLAPLLLLFAGLGYQAWAYGRTTLTQLNLQMSIAAPLQRHAAAVAAGTLPDTKLGLYRIRDPALSVYGPDPLGQTFLTSRNDLDLWLAEDEPRVALLRRSDLAPVYSTARVKQSPLHVLDASHHDYVLVANFLAEGWTDQNPLLGVAFDEPLTLANETLVGWEPYIELIAWEIDGELHRGSTATMHMIFRVHRPLPSGTKLYARLQKGKSSRAAAKPHELAGGAMPPNYWRDGDYIHHTHTIEVPWLEILPGEHEVIVGLRRSEKTNLKISTPEQKKGEFGVVVQGKSHEFAVIGAAEIEW